MSIESTKDLVGKYKPLNCPLCNRKIGTDVDYIYSSGIWHAEIEEGIKAYYSHRDRPEHALPCYEINCPVDVGGCGLSLSADSLEELIDKWNTRNGVKYV